MKSVIFHRAGMVKWYHTGLPSQRRGFHLVSRSFQLILSIYNSASRGVILLHPVSPQYLQNTGRMPKLTETFVRGLPQATSGTRKFWDSEVKGLALFVGQRAKTWYFQKDVGGQTKRILIGHNPAISAQIARQTSLGLRARMGQGCRQADRTRRADPGRGDGVLSRTPEAAF
jgi:hypothetical protein